MITLLIIFLMLVSIILMGVVLIQSSKGGGLAGTFGGADASAVFGVRRTADFLIKLTSVLAGILLLFSLITNILINKGGAGDNNIIQDNPSQQNFPAPTVPDQLIQPPADQQNTPSEQPNNQQPENQPK